MISTGTPPGVGQIKPGDVVEIEIERIGRASDGETLIAVRAITIANSPS
jgi:hypothetical protein